MAVSSHPPQRCKSMLPTILPATLQPGAIVMKKAIDGWTADPIIGAISDAMIPGAASGGEIMTLAEAGREIGAH